MTFFDVATALPLRLKPVLLSGCFRMTIPAISWSDGCPLSDVSDASTPAIFLLSSPLLESPSWARLLRPSLSLLCRPPRSSLSAAVSAAVLVSAPVSALAYRLQMAGVIIVATSIPPLQPLALLFLSTTCLPAACTFHALPAVADIQRWFAASSALLHELFPAVLRR